MNADVAIVFNEAKSKFGYADDSTTFGQTEYWATHEEMMAAAVAGKVKGDCDDFAELCVHPLREKGLPARFILCLTETKEAHLVAEVDGIILDNRQVYPTPIDFLPYTWLACSGEKPEQPWHIIIGVS
jgi:predicted transglutaminase-like cysteine proteinase